MENMLINVLVPIWLDHVRSIRCPNCGSDTKQIGFVIEDEPKRPLCPGRSRT
jgi:hypothetical protein